MDGESAAEALDRLFTEPEWRKRVNASNAEWVRKRNARAKERAEMAERRDFGLVLRHAAKLQGKQD